MFEDRIDPFPCWKSGLDDAARTTHGCNVSPLRCENRLDLLDRRKKRVAVCREHGCREIILKLCAGMSADQERQEGEKPLAIHRYAPFWTSGRIHTANDGFKVFAVPSAFLSEFAGHFTVQ